MTTTAPVEQVSVQPTARRRTVLWWAGFGAAMVLLQLYVYGSWIASDDFKVVPTGIDPVPDSEKMWAVMLQVAFTATALATTAWIVRGCVKQRRLTFDAKLMLGWWSILWLDPAQFFLRPINLYNSYYFNRGSWVTHIPGWIAHNVQNLPNPWFMEGAAYGFMILSSIAVCLVLAKVRARRPRTSGVLLFAVGWVLLGLGIFVLEEYIMIRGGWLSWSGVIHEVSIFDGTRYQFPWTESFFFGAMCTGMAALRFWRDDRGRSFVERGSESIASSRKATIVSVLAIIGFANVIMIAYNLVMIVQSLYVDPTPEIYPSYMLNGICGAGTEFRCPGPDVPIVLNHRH
jgi:hypothetical protein